MELLPEQREQYLRDGFLLLPGLFHPDALDRFESRFVEIASGSAPTSDGMVVMRDVMFAKGASTAKAPVDAVNKLLSFETDEDLFAYALDRDLLLAVRSLIGPELITISTNFFNKPPGVDGRHPLHQDLRYFALRPENQILATWTAVSATTRANGCLCVIPGSHRRGLLEHKLPNWEFVNGGFFAAQGIDLEARVHVEMNAGDTLLFHPLLVHGSGRNKSAACRRAISTHYAWQGCERLSGERKREPAIRTIPNDGSDRT